MGEMILRMQSALFEHVPVDNSLTNRLLHTVDGDLKMAIARSVAALDLAIHFEACGWKSGRTQRKAGQAVCSLLTDKERLREMGEEAKHTMQSYAIPEATQQLLDVYQAGIERHAQARH